MRRILREVLKKQFSYSISLDIVVRMHKTFYKKNFKQIEEEIQNLIKGLPS